MADEKNEEELFDSGRDQRRKRFQVMKERAKNLFKDDGTAAAGAEGAGGRAAGGDRSKQVATFMLNVVQSKTKKDTEAGVTPTPIVGTAFTVEGVTRLLEMLQKRSEAAEELGKGVPARIHAFLTTPPASGQPLVAGVNLKNLERFQAFLLSVEAVGMAAARREFKSAGGDNFMQAFGGAGANAQGSAAAIAGDSGSNIRRMQAKMEAKKAEAKK